jgi:hypothetical protein
VVPLHNGYISVGNEGGPSEKDAPSVKSRNFDYPNCAPPEGVTQYGVYCKSHWVQGVPLAYSARDSTQNGQRIQEQSSAPCARKISERAAGFIEGSELPSPARRALLQADSWDVDVSGRSMT